VFTYVTSPAIDGNASVLQCFHFWFYIDGFMDGAKNESLKVVQESTGDIPDRKLWNHQSATLQWTEVSRPRLEVNAAISKGQMEVRAVEHSGAYTGWKVHLLGTKPGDMTAFLAVDDFTFKQGDDICETLPAGAGPATTPATPTTSTRCPSTEGRPHLVSPQPPVQPR
jgi:hypothetical protein